MKKRAFFIAVSFLVIVFDGWAHNKVVVIPFLGDDSSLVSKTIKNVVIVAIENGDFTSPIDAIDSITDASSLNPYLIFIAPGQYVIPGHQQLVMKPHINLVGSGREITTLFFSKPTTPSLISGLADPGAALVVAASHNSTIADLTINGQRNAQHAVGLHVPTDSSLRVRNTSLNILINQGPGTPAGFYV